MLYFELFAYGVSTTFTPADGAEAAQGSAVTFSGESGVIEPNEGHPEELPLRFEIASSEEALSKGSYLDSGAGRVSPGIKPERRKYSLTSSRVTTNTGDIYWQASFTHYLAKCGKTVTFNTGSGFSKPYVVSVVSPSETPTQVPSPGGGNTNYSKSTPTGLKVGVTASRLVHIGHTAVAYLVDCTATCTGKTSVQAWELRGRRKPASVRALAFGPRKVSITGTSGGNERFVMRFRGRALRELRSILRSGHEVKLVITASVKDSKGNPVHAQRVVLLKR